MPRVHAHRDHPDGPVTGWSLFCPACKEHHSLNTGWSFNGDRDRPTFSPSLLVRSGHHIPGHNGDCWCDFNHKHPEAPAPFHCYVCHSLIRDGRIEFLSDCTHALAGQTVDLPEFQ